MNPAEQFAATFTPDEQATLRDAFGIRWLDAAARLILHRAEDEEEIEALFSRLDDEARYGMTFEEPARKPDGENAARKSPCECLEWRTDRPPVGETIIVWDREHAVVHVGRAEVDDEQMAQGDIWKVKPLTFIAVETRAEWDGETLSREEEILDDAVGLPWRHVVSIHATRTKKGAASSALPNATS